MTPALKVDPQKTKIELNCRAIKPILIYFEKKYGRAQLEEFIQKTDMPLAYLEDENNWVSFHYFKSVLRALVEYTGDVKSLFDAGGCATSKEAYGSLYYFLRTFVSPSLMYKKAAEFSSSFSKIGEMKIWELKKNKAVIHARYLPGFEQDDYNCLHLQGQLASIPTAWGLPVSQVKHRQCQAHGADFCVYEFTWINRPSKIYGFLGAIGGAAVAGVLCFFQHGQIESSWFRDAVVLASFMFGGFCFGHCLSLKAIDQDNVSLYEGQNEALRKSLKDIEQLNADLQSKVEKRTEELSISNEKLQKAMDDLRRSQDQLIQSEKMASVGRLAAGMAHELNNPVGAVRNFIQDVLEDTPQDDPRWERLKRAEKATERCRGIICDLLTFARENKDLKLVDINKLIQDIVLHKTQDASDKGISVVQELASGLPMVTIDAMQIQQVLVNIIRNACDAITGTGKIVVKTFGSPGRVFIEIADTGHGIPENIQDKIFDPFFTTKSPGKGMGLGLSISYNIIKRFGGDIQVKSVQGKGASFTVMLPVA